ncbi:hypothetical protein RQP46_009786 [Phenoliferia psychrophenolica]
MHFSLFHLAALLAGLVSFSCAQVHCGTTSDATLSDCHDLIDNVDNWNSASNTGNPCSFGALVPEGALNVACRNNCCVYVARNVGDIDRETTRLQAQGMFGCGSVEANKINVLQVFPDGHGVCISDGNGCGDCFDDGDFQTTRLTRFARRGRKLEA